MKDVLYWDAFKVMNLDIAELLPFKGTLVGSSREQVQVLGHLPAIMTFGSGDSVKSVKVRYLIVNVASPYNIIIIRSSFNALEATLSTLYLILKYPLEDGCVGAIKVDQGLARKYYKDSLKLQKKAHAEKSIKCDHLKVNLVDIYPIEDPMEDSLTPIKDVKKVYIGAQIPKTTQIGSNLSLKEEAEIISILKENVNLFTWKLADMLGIRPNIVCHHLALDSTIKSMSQRKQKDGEEKIRVIEDEVGKLLKVGFIQEIKYPIWLANIVMVKKKSGKWRMCVDFTDLNKTCPSDPYLLPHIDRLIDGAFSFNLLSYMDAYSSYNQIRMNLLDAPKTEFMTNNSNYYYEVTPFRLKNIWATYQRLMDMVFASQIG